VDLTEAIFDVIDMGSFSSIWYWIVLAVIWSSASHWVLGVPFDMIARARRQGGQAEADLDAMVRLSVARILYVTQISAGWIMGFAAFFYTALLMLALWYRIELAQAIALIALPLTCVGLMSVAAAQQIAANALDGVTLYRRLVRHRLWTQVIGMVSIFVTATYGMYHNLAVPAGL